MSPVGDSIRELARLIEDAGGFVVADHDLGRLEDLARERAAAIGMDGPAEYVRRLEGKPGWGEWRRLLGSITNKESFLYRGQAQIEAIRDLVVPELMGSTDRRPIRLWSAGCARGEEAATLALVMDAVPGLGHDEWRILATDVDEAALADARRGIFTRRAVARVPKQEIERGFARCGDSFELRPRLQQNIEYRFLNLAAEPLQAPWAAFDIVLLRNVLIYFRQPVKVRVVEAVEASLTNGGRLFLGPSESLHHLGTRLEVQDLGACWCHRQGGGASTPSLRQPPASAPTAGTAGEPCPVVHGPAGGESAVETVDEEFAHALAAALEDLERGAPTRDLSAVDRLRRRFAEDASVHAVEGLLRERTGDQEAAVAAYRAALYLEPSRYDIRFLLARALEEGGRWRRAEREYRSVMSSLHDPHAPAPVLSGRAGVPQRELLEIVCRERLIYLIKCSQH